MFVFIAGAHGMLIAVALYRMTQRRAPHPATPVESLPRTSLINIRLFRRNHHDAQATATAENGRKP
jgi:hypothetical protein